MSTPAPAASHVSLPDFIAEIGDPAAAHLFEAELRTVQAWRRRERFPRPEKAQQMVAVSEGRLTMDGIYGGDAERRVAGG